MNEQIENIIREKYPTLQVDIVDSDESELNPENITVVKTDHTEVRGSVIYLDMGSMESIKEFLAEAARSAEAKRMHNFKCAMADAIDARVKEYKDNIESNKSTADQKEHELVEIYRKINTDLQALSALDGTKGQWKQKAESEFEYLTKLLPNQYRSIGVTNGILTAHTHNIQIRYDGSTYEIGEFDIKITLAMGNLEITNTTNPIEEHDHPHIDNGAACLGNIKNGVIKLLAEFELFGALQVIHTFLHSYNPNSCYLKIEYWDPDYEEDQETRYDACHDDNRGYRCVECGDGNCPYYENAYDDCSEFSDAADCKECEYLCSFGRAKIKEEEDDNN